MRSRASSVITGGVPGRWSPGGRRAESHAPTFTKRPGPGAPPRGLACSCVSDAWLIEPAGPLRGEVEVRGSKNAVTKHMVAAILGQGPSTITNVPDVGDVDITAGILAAVGAGVERAGRLVTVTPPTEVNPAVPLSFSGLNRIPVLLLGPLLHLTGEAFVPRVGGDQLGQPAGRLPRRRLAGPRAPRWR